MHMIFTKEELVWIESDKFGWPIKRGCPQEIRKSITAKKEKLDKQMGREFEEFMREDREAKERGISI